MWLAVAVIYGLTGTIMDSVGYSWDTYQFWCMMALLFALEKAVRIDLMHELQTEYKKILAEEKEKEPK